jgi:hypothetical protein
MDLRKLLLKDLSARLPYGVKCEIDDIDEPLELESIKFKGDYFIFGNGVYERYITEIKPYLRPMSSMTEEERNEYFDFRSQELQRVAFAEVGREEAISEVMDWLLSHHFDIRGLIEKGLALEAPEGMYGI